MIQAQTEVLQAKQNAIITLTNARASSMVVLSNANFEALSIKATIFAERDAYMDIMNTFGLDTRGLINYIAIQTLQNSEHLTMNVQSPGKFSF